MWDRLMALERERENAMGHVCLCLCSPKGIIEIFFQFLHMQVISPKRRNFTPDTPKGQSFARMFDGLHPSQKVCWWKGMDRTWLDYWELTFLWHPLALFATCINIGISLILYKHWDFCTHAPDRGNLTCVYNLFDIWCTIIYTYLEPKWPLFWLEKAFFWGGDLQK